MMLNGRTFGGGGGGGGMGGMMANISNMSGMYNMDRIGIRTGHGNGMMHSMKSQGGGSLESFEHRQDLREEDAIRMAKAKFKEQPGCKVELDDLTAKRWQKDTKKYFNYNFNEDKWRMYANKQYKMRKLVENISFKNTNKENFVVRPTLDSFRARIAVECPEGSLCDVPDAILEATPLDHRFIDCGFEIPDMYGFSDAALTLVTADESLEEEEEEGGDGGTEDNGHSGSGGGSDGNRDKESGGSDNKDEGERDRRHRGGDVKVSGEKRKRTFPESEKQKNDEEIDYLIGFLSGHTKPWTLNNNYIPGKRQKFGIDKQQMMQ